MTLTPKNMFYYFRYQLFT